MELVKEISIRKLGRAKSLLVILFGLGLMVCVLLLRYDIYTHSKPLYVLIALPFVMVLHEASHGLLFKVWTGKVKFGAKWITRLGGPIFYATSPNSTLSRDKFIAVALAPQVLTILFFLLSYFSFQQWFLIGAVAFAATNLGGGCMDLYSIFVLLRFPKSVKVQDSLEGLSIYKES